MASDLDHDALQTAHLLDRLGQLVRAEEQAGDLHPAQWSALRYLERANRFSRTPIALARYLGATRGTVSQTLIALERKELLTRVPSPRDKRSVVLELTATGDAKLTADPIKALALRIADSLGADVAALRDLLARIARDLIAEQEGRAFGVCRDCRHFRMGGGQDAPHRCALLEVDLSDHDAARICAEQEAA